MDIEQFRAFCLNKKGVTESFPFDEDVLVFKVLNKMFALTSLKSNSLKVSLKCDPERAIELRERFESIKAAYHMNKKHWNSVDTSSLLDDKLFLELVNHSYSLVVKGLTKKDRTVLENL